MHGPAQGITRVLIVDDSATMRALVRLALERDPRVHVVGEAQDPFEARTAIKALNPDVLTLDVEMPRMDGLEFLEKIMRLRPMPVVMLSSQTQAGSTAAVLALSLGAVDCVAKVSPDGAPCDLSGLGEKLVMAHHSCRFPVHAPSPEVSQGMRAPAYKWGGKIVLIGASTGGVNAIEAVIGRFPANCPPTIITQHMPETYLASFANRLDQRMAPVVRLAEDGMPFSQGTVAISPGGATHTVVRGRNALQLHLEVGDKVSGHRPSVDVLFRSAVPTADRVVAALLTGMGRDGADGLRTLHDAGAHTIAQNEASCVVYGMPRVAVELGAADEVLALPAIGDRLLTLCASSQARQAGVLAG